MIAGVNRRNNGANCIYGLMRISKAFNAVPGIVYVAPVATSAAFERRI